MTHCKLHKNYNWIVMIVANLIIIWLIQNNHVKKAHKLELR